MLDKNEIYKALAKVNDPELNRNLAELNMIKEVTEEQGNINVVLSLTVMGCPMKNKIENDVVDELMKLDGAKNVTVKFVEMTNEEKKKLFSDNKKTINDFKNTVILAIGSGKGGVGKSTITANISIALSRLGFKVGVLDADILGYSIPQIMGIKDQRPKVIGENIIIPIEKFGIKTISMGNLVDDEKPLIWRGPILAGIFTQFLNEVSWGKLDFLLLDLPPGTGDIPLSIMQQVNDSKFIIVTTPQITAKDVARRLGYMAQRTNTKILGVIENMSYFVCDKCGEKHYIFGKGEGLNLSKELGVDLLGEVPLLKEIREGSDKGKLPILKYKEVERIYMNIGENIVNHLK